MFDKGWEEAFGLPTHIMSPESGCAGLKNCLTSFISNAIAVGMHSRSLPEFQTTDWVDRIWKSCEEVIWPTTCPCGPKIEAISSWAISADQVITSIPQESEKGLRWAHHCAGHSSEAFWAPVAHSIVHHLAAKEMESASNHWKLDVDRCHHLATLFVIELVMMMHGQEVDGGWMHNKCSMAPEHLGHQW